MDDEITSYRVRAVRTQRLDEEPETTFLTFETEAGQITFHMRTTEVAALAAQLAKDAKGITQ